MQQNAYDNKCIRIDDEQHSSLNNKKSENMGARAVVFDLAGCASTTEELRVCERQVSRRSAPLTSASRQAPNRIGGVLQHETR